MEIEIRTEVPPNRIDPDYQKTFTEDQIVAGAHRNYVFWYYRRDLEWAAGFGPWECRFFGDWGHPVGQMMMEFTRTRSS